MPPAILRNLIAAAVLASPVVLTLISGCAAFANSHAMRPAAMAWTLVALGSAIAGFNLHFAFVRPVLYARRHAGSVEGLRHVSGIPIVGSIFCALAVMSAWGHIWIACASLLILLADPSGVVWLLVFLSRDPSLWRGR